MAIAERWKGFAELPADFKQKVQQLPPLLKEHGVLLAYLFGSLSRGNAPHDGAHDVDLAIWSTEVPAYRLRQPISDCLGTERLDLVDLQRASPVLRFEILRTGQPIYVADEDFQQRYELQTIRVYQDTSYLRRRQREILKERFGSWSSNQKRSMHGSKS
jgi:predicted nucleotidyltransferase